MRQPLTFIQHFTLARPCILAYPYITIYLSCFLLNLVSIDSYPLQELTDEQDMVKGLKKIA
jgi:hypothetical protein